MQEGKGTPLRFKLTIGSAELRLNYSVQFDTMFFARTASMTYDLRGFKLHCGKVPKAKICKRSFARDPIYVDVSIYRAPRHPIGRPRELVHLVGDERKLWNHRNWHSRGGDRNTGDDWNSWEVSRPAPRVYMNIRSDLDRNTTKEECMTKEVY